MEEKTIKCDCGEEILLVTKDEESFYLSMFDRQFTKYTLKHRLHLIWQIIRHGKPYVDQIVINAKNARELAKFLNKK